MGQVEHRNSRNSGTKANKSVGGRNGVNKSRSNVGNSAKSSVRNDSGSRVSRANADADRATNASRVADSAATQHAAVEPPEGLLYGSNPVREALRKGRPITRVWVSRDKNDRISAEIISLCQKANIPFSKTEKAYLDRMCFGMPHQGFAAQAAPKAYTPWQEMIAAAVENGEAPLLLLLDEVEDPYNLGAVLRSIDALGAHGAVIPKHRAAPLTAGVARASAGAWEYVMVDRVTNMAMTIDKMKKEGLWVIGATADTGQTIYHTDMTGPIALVLGGENKGLSPMIQKKCDLLVRIPMQGKINSLNVSAAAAVIMSEIIRQRSIWSTET